MIWSRGTFTASHARHTYGVRSYTSNTIQAIQMQLNKNKIKVQSQGEPNHYIYFIILKVANELVDIDYVKVHKQN